MGILFNITLSQVSMNSILDKALIFILIMCFQCLVMFLIVKKMGLEFGKNIQAERKEVLKSENFRVLSWVAIFGIASISFMVFNVLYFGQLMHVK